MGPSPELWPLDTEALASAMEVSLLEAKRVGIGGGAAVVAAAGRLRSPVTLVQVAVVSTMTLVGI